MRRRTLVLAVAAAMSVMMAAPAGAHPVTPPGHGGDVVAFAGGSTPAHTKGLACAEDRSPAIGALPIPCVLGP